MHHRLLLSLGLAGTLFLVGCTDNDNNEDASDEQTENAEVEENGAGSSEAIAEVGDLTLTEDEFNEELRDRHGSQVLNDLVQTLVLRDKADEMDISDEEVEEELDDFREQLGAEDDDELLELLEVQFQISVDSIDELKEEFMKPQIVLQELAAEDVDISEEEKEAYFEENEEDLVEVEARHILLEDEETALELIAQLEEGADFGELAEEYSEDPGSAAEGGELGSFGRGTMVSEFEDTAFDLEPGEVSEPVESEHGYHIIEVLNIQDSYEELDENIERILEEEQTRSGEEILLELLEDTDVQVNEEYEDWLQY
ncbi:peptidylprolyl isomerase [Salsuginibacillus kocurii]|uniref:peptidylprolyl isomerase n=1 Tax=Salsuginibacillus kocurii TaxID=427078 RepID=UPI000368A6E5|nr:peptidylprolyl isomerase [Salsuginibacillus kocurii]